MNIWDSVQRGLEKATQEATRRARVQRLRSTIEKLTEETHTQEDTLIVRAMELFAARQLTQNELLPICQELVRLQQLLDQAQYELKMIQSQGQSPASTPTSGNTPAPASSMSPPPYAPGEFPPVTYPISSPDYQSNDQTIPIPPPPPGIEPLIALDSLRADAPTIQEQTCPHCRVELIPGDAYCHNCGAPVGKGELTRQPTVLIETQEAREASASQSPASEEKDGGA